MMQKTWIHALVTGLACLLAWTVLTASAPAQRRVVIMGGDEPKVDTTAKEKIIDEVTKALKEVYVFPEKAEAMATLVRKKLEEGEYDAIDRIGLFTQQLTQDLRSVCHDRHLSVFPELPQPPGAAEGSDEEEDRGENLRYQNYGFQKLELLPGNIGYLDLRMFADASAARPPRWRP